MMNFMSQCGMCFAEAHLGASQAERKLIFSSNLKTSRPRGPATAERGRVEGVEQGRRPRLIRDIPG